MINADKDKYRGPLFVRIMVHPPTPFQLEARRAERYNAEGGAKPPPLPKQTLELPVAPVFASALIKDNQ